MWCPMSKKCLFLAAWELDQSDGITKKIWAQISALEKMFDDVDYWIISKGEVCTNLSSKKLHKTYDAVYVRNCNGLPTLSFFKYLIGLKKKQVYYEIPTFPYRGEASGWRSMIEYYIKKFFLRFFVDRIIYIGDAGPKIWGIPAQEITNGISDPVVPPRINTPTNSEVINAVGMASQAVWHGYDRILKGMAAGGCANRFRFHVIGDGPALSQLKKMADKLSLDSSVIFHGRLEGDRLKKVLSDSDIGIDSLGRHRVGNKYNSSLKAKEYLAYGLPLVMSHIDKSVFESQYVLKLDASDKDVDIDKIILFAKINKNKRKDIQEFAYERFSWLSIFKEALNNP